MSRVKVNEITNKVATGPVDFPDGITGVALTVTGNVTVGGTIISEDTTNVDSVGWVTAPSGLNVGPPATGIGATVHSNGNAVFAGILTASSFEGDGSALTGVISGVDIRSGGSFLGAGVTDINWASGATVTASGAGATVTIAAGITTTSAYSQSGMITLNLGSGNAHEITLAAGISTFTVTGGTVGESHSLIVTQPSSGITTVGFATYFLWPSGSPPNMSKAAASSEIDMVTFVVKQETQTGTGVTQLLASAGLDYQ